MKKLFFTLLAFVCYGVIMAQTTVDLPAHYKNFPSADVYVPQGAIFDKQGGNVSGWYDPEAFIRNNSTGPFQNYVGIVFPDSTVINIDENNKPHYVFSHAFGHMFDLRHENWAAVPSDPNVPVLPFAQKDSYVLDSVGFYYVYRRNNPDPTVVDTCYVSFYKNSENNNLSRGSILFGNGDTMLFATVNGLNQKTLAGISPFLTKTILLTAEDTTGMGQNGWLSKVMTEHVGTTISRTTSSTVSRNPNSWFGYTVTFKPGHAWSPGDTVESRGFVKPAKGVNYFGYRYVTITVGGLPATLRSRDYAENSLLLHNTTRYGQTTANGWSGFMPGTAFTDPVYVNAEAFVTGVSTLRKEQLEKQGFAMELVYPNPATAAQNLTVEYSLKTPAVISIAVYDLLGKQVAVVAANEPTQPGTHTATIAAGLKPGMYFYTLSIGGVTVGTQKFSITQ